MRGKEDAPGLRNSFENWLPDYGLGTLRVSLARYTRGFKRQNVNYGDSSR